METERSAHRFAVVLSAIAVPGLLSATVLAATSGFAGRTILGEAASPIEGVIGAGAVLYERGGVWLNAVRQPAAVLGLLAAIALLTRRTARRGVWPLVVALVLGGVAQAFLLAESIGIGLALYAVAVAVVLTAARPPSPATSPAGELPLALGLLALFGAVCLYRLDVYPNLYVDEMAYLRAARMFAGQIEVGRILGSEVFSVYVYDQFLAQTVPLMLQAVAVSLLPSDVIATRLLSVLAVAAALLTIAITLRRPLGGRVTSWMLALAVSAPLVVVYSRAGHYLSISLLHSALAFAALLWLWRRWDAPAAMVVGGILGSSLYQYQLSWFVPLFAGVAFLLSPELWRRTGVVKVVVTVGLVATAVALPGLLWFESGFRAVGAQTFDHRAVWNAPGAVPEENRREEKAREEKAREGDEPEGFAVALAIAPDRLDDSALDAVAAEIAARELSVRRDATARGESLLWIAGGAEPVDGLAGELREDGWRLLGLETVAKNPGVRLRRMLAQLFYAIGWETSGRWIAAPLLNPMLAPLLVVGFALGWRRRGEPAVRLILIWVALGALLPAVVGGPMPRRTHLMLPFAYALMALPLVELGAALRGRSFGRPLAVALAAALFVAATATGSFLYFRQWEQQPGQPGGGGEILDFVKVLKGRPVDETVLMPRLYDGLENYLDAGDASRYWPERVARRLRKNPARFALRMSCEGPPPFSWMIQDKADQRAAMAGVEEHFEVETEVRSGIRALRVTEARGAICRRR